MLNSLKVQAGKKLHVVGFTDGRTRSIILDRDVTLYQNGNYLIGDVLYRVKAIRGEDVFIEAV